MKAAVAKFSLICVSLIFLGLIFADLSSAKIDPETFAGVWLFDEGKGKVAEDLSANGNDGELVGNLKWVEGKFDSKALEFDGTTHVDCGNPDSLNIDGEAITLAAWVNPNTIAGLDAVIEKECGGSAGYNLYLNGGRVHFRLFANANVFSEPAEVVPTGSWTHICAVYDGSDMMVYINGAVKDEDKQSGKITTNEIKLGIGTSISCGGRGFDGIIDEVAVFNVALTEGDVNEIMTKGLFGVLAVSPKEKLATTWGLIKTDE
jgi:hypothetical protein